MTQKLLKLLCPTEWEQFGISIVRSIWRCIWWALVHLVRRIAFADLLVGTQTILTQEDELTRLPESLREAVERLHAILPGRLLLKPGYEVGFGHVICQTEEPYFISRDVQAVPVWAI